MNKRPGNTVILDGTVPADAIKKMIDDSYQIVVDNLPTAQREELEKRLHSNNSKRHRYYLLCRFLFPISA